MNNTSEKLIQISIKTFSEKGYHGTSLNDLAIELGIKKPVYITILLVKMIYMKSV